MTESNLNITDSFQPFSFEVKVPLKFIHGSLESTCTQKYTRTHKNINLKTRGSMDLFLPLDICSQISPVLVEKFVFKCENSPSV